MEKNDFFENVSKTRSIKVFFTDFKGLKTELFTQINGTPEEIVNYYGNNWFNFGDTDDYPQDLMMKAEKIYFIAEDITINILRATNEGGHC